MENNKIIAIIILLILMLAAFFLGWLISKLVSGAETMEVEDDSTAVLLAEKEAELERCRSTNASLQSQLAAIDTTPVINTISPVSTLAVVNSPKKDDLKIVEGIGPKIEELLNNASIHTYEQLKETSIARLNEILEAAGPRYQMHKPDTWPEQAGLAASGNWTALKILQDSLNKGKVE